MASLSKLLTVHQWLTPKTPTVYDVVVRNLRGNFLKPLCIQFKLHFYLVMLYLRKQETLIRHDKKMCMPSPEIKNYLDVPVSQTLHL